MIIFKHVCNAMHKNREEACCCSGMLPVVLMMLIMIVYAPPDKNHMPMSVNLSKLARLIAIIIISSEYTSSNGADDHHFHSALKYLYFIFALML